MVLSFPDSAPGQGEQGLEAGEQRWEGWEEREKNASPLKFAKKPFTLEGHHVSVDEAPLFVPGFYKFANQG